MDKKECILVFSAHSDDFVLGAGGTIAQYAKDGKKVEAIVFSYGENSHPWLKKKVARKMRLEEAAGAGKILKCKVTFLDHPEGHFLEHFQKNSETKLLELLNKKKPSKIFTHSSEDPHPDHRALNKITLELLEKMEKKAEIYTYSIWNPISLKTILPTLYQDIGQTFSFKLKAIKIFRSQHVHISYPVLLLIFRNFMDGWHIKKRWAEKFFKIK